MAAPLVSAPSGPPISPPPSRFFASSSPTNPTNANSDTTFDFAASSDQSGMRISLSPSPAVNRFEFEANDEPIAEPLLFALAGPSVLPFTACTPFLVGRSYSIDRIVAALASPTARAVVLVRFAHVFPRSLPIKIDSFFPLIVQTIQWIGRHWVFLSGCANRASPACSSFRTRALGCRGRDRV